MVSISSSPLLQPCIHRLVPQHAVLRFKYPVILIRKRKKFTRNALTLQSSESPKALRDGNPKIIVRMDHQHRHSPIFNVIDGIELLVVVRHFKLPPAIFMLLEQQLIGVVIHHKGVEYAVMINQALPRFVPNACDPIRHVAAIACAKRAGTVAIKKAKLIQRRLPTTLQILQRLAAPVA
jgi:hypothetical protein